jgi:hypothetical protein
LPCLALPCLALPYLPCLALHCLALPCLALPCLVVVLPCLVVVLSSDGRLVLSCLVRCLVLSCPVLTGLIFSW